MSKGLRKIAGIFGFNADNAEEDDDYQDSYEDEDSYNDEEDGYDDGSSYSSSRGYENSRGFSSSEYSRREPSLAPIRQSTPRVVTHASYRNAPRNNKVVNLNASVQMQVYVCSPESIEAAREIAEQIKEKKPVIINLERVEYTVAQRITDFLCGCCCAMNGNVQRIADKIFMIAPDNIDFAGDMALQQTLNQGDLGFLYGEKEE